LRTKKKLEVKVKKIAASVLILLMMSQGALISWSSTIPAVSSAPAGQYRLVSAGTYDLFTNHVDGYSLFVPKGMTVDMSYSEVGAALENENKRIEIYKQNISGIGKTAYINYSKRFLYNWMDHVTEFRGEETIGGYEVTVTAWSRKKLSGIENDKNNYVCLELSFGNFVYTILVKANAPLYRLGGYAYLIDNFRIEAVTATPYVRKSSAVDVDTRGWNDETRAFYEKYFDADASLTWGIFEPDTAEFDYTKLKGYEAFFEYEFPIILNYSEFQNTYRHPNLKQRLETARNHGKVLVLTLQTPLGGMPDGSNQVYKILNGEYDRFLADYAQVIADFGHPVMFRLGNEMNGDWCDYSAFHTSKDTVIFREWWKYVYGFFERAGANANTIWVWNPNGVSFPNFKWNDELMYYPGDQYVDVVGLTKYNTGTYYYRYGERWQEFHELYDDIYARYIKHYGQSLMIPEFASASMGGDKEQWVINMFEHIRNYDRIKMAIWWDGCDWDAEGNIARSYFIDETPGLMEIFRQNLRPDWRRGVFG